MSGGAGQSAGQGPGIGHNGGPGLGGSGWHVHCWRQARKGLLGERLPVEVIRTRIRRAEALGLDYRTYASVRAQTGRDVIGFLFSSNALRAFAADPAIPEDRAERLRAVAGAARVALVHRPLEPARLLDANPAALDTAHQAPPFLAALPAARAALQAAKGRMPADGVLFVGDTGLEAEWAEAARLAGYLPAERYFATAG